MRTKQLVPLLLLLSSLPLLAVSWTPTVSLGAGYEGVAFVEKLDSSRSLGSSAYAEGRLNPLAISFGRNRISLPATFSMVSTARLSTRTEKQAEETIGAELEYELRAAEHLAIAISGGFRASRYVDADAWSVSYGGTFSYRFPIAGFFSVDVPLSFYKGSNGFSFRAGAAMTLSMR